MANSSLDLPADNAWVPRATDPELVVRWLYQCAADRWPGRVTVVPLKSQIRQDRVVADFAANGNVHSGKGTRGRAGGPVLAYMPTIELLADALRLAAGGALGIVEYHEGEVAGWAAAANAINLATGQRAESVPPAIHDALVQLKDAGYGGFHRDRESYFAQKYFPPIDALLAAGYDYRFVASYLTALGVTGKSVGEDLKRIYVPHGGNVGAFDDGTGPAGILPPIRLAEVVPTIRAGIGDNGQRRGD